MKCIGVILIVALLHTVTGKRTPTISYISQEQIKNIGQSGELRCSVKCGGKYPVQWIKMNGAAPVWISLGSALVIPDSRFSFRYCKAASRYTLLIKDFQETDEGRYRCQVVLSPRKVVSAEVKLHLRKPPFITDNSTLSEVVAEGDEVQLQCYADGFPPPEITWRRENNALLPSGHAIYRGNVLTITSVTKEDRGIYYCVADNGIGREQKRIIIIEVQFAPVITTLHPRLGQNFQFDMYLECHIEAYPLPEITWHKNGVQLKTDQHYAISHFTTPDEYTDTTLRVITIEQRQYGEYVCKAQNKLGSAEAKVELFRTTEKICPPACK